MRERTKKFYETADLSKRKSLGQYMTPDSLRNVLWENVKPLFSGRFELDILEPSAGTGEFVDDALNIFPEAEVFAYEKDGELNKELSSEFDSFGRFSVLGSDYFEKSEEGKYDLIVGNPPYFEMKDAVLAEKYPFAFSGRQNISAFFVAKALSELKSRGVMAFVLPSSINTGYYFKDLRKELVRNGSIKFMKTLHSDFFEGAKQSVTVFVYRKGDFEGNDRFRIDCGEYEIFSENYEEYAEYAEGKESLSDIGLSATTGQLVWNQRKDDLRNTFEEGCVRIIYSHNITEKRTLEDSDKKPQFVMNGTSLVGPAMVFNRIVGGVGRGKLKGAFIKSGEKFLAENHVNVVLGRDEDSLLEIFNRMMERNHTKALSVLGNTQLSSKELSKIIKF